MRKEKLHSKLLLNIDGRMLKLARANYVSLNTIELVYLYAGRPIKMYITANHNRILGLAGMKNHKYHAKKTLFKHFNSKSFSEDVEYVLNKNSLEEIKKPSI